MNRLRSKLYSYGVIAMMIAAFSCLYVKYPETNLITNSSKTFYTLGTSSITSTYLLNDVNYYGNTGTYKVIDSFGNSTKIYSDVNTTISDAPYYLINSEMLLLPNGDKNVTESTMLSFKVYRGVDIYVLRDNRITTDPSWLASSSFTKTADTVTSSSGTIYDIWKISVSASSSGTTVNIGPNVTSVDDLNSADNQVILIKETSKVTSRKFFYYDFDDITNDELVNGFSLSTGNNITVGPAEITDSNNVTKDALLFDDNSGSLMGDILKSFNPLSGVFTMEYKAYVSYNSATDDNTSKNTWLRMFLHSSKPSSDTDKSTRLLETYLYRVESDLTVVVANSAGTNQTLATGIALNEWHTFKYIIDVPNHILTLYIDGVLGNGAQNGATLTNPLFRQKTLTSASYIEFGSGKSHLSYYAIDDVQLTPTLGIGLTGVTIPGIGSINVDSNSTSYNIVSSSNPETATYNIDKTNDYYSHTVTTNSTGAHIVVTNNNMETFEFDITFIRQSIFIGYDVRGDSSLAIDELFQNSQVVHFLDTSTTSQVYLEKNLVNDYNTGLRVSYDVYFNNNSNVDNSLIFNYATSGQLGSSVDLTKVVTNSYLNTIQNTSDIGFKFVSDTTTYDDTVVTKGAWHNIKYDISVVDKTYSVYLDNNLVFTANFYNDLTSINNIAFGTDIAGTADFYVKNVNVVEIGGYPLDSVSLDGVSLTNWNKDVLIYDYYTASTLSNSTTIDLSFNNYYQSHTTNIDTTNQTITISAVDNKNQSYIYVINYLNPIDENVTLQMLQNLYDETTLLLPTENQYTVYTFGVLVNARSDALTVINDTASISTDYAYAYYVLREARDHLLQSYNYDDTNNLDVTETNATSSINFSTTCVYTEKNTVIRETQTYEVSLVSTIKYSSNLDNSFYFEKVLENGSNAYMIKNADDTQITFTSVPYKYMNAEYLVMKNNLYYNASFNFTSNQNIHLLIFKDWDTGPFIGSLVIDGNTYTFVDTNEIVTTSNGKIYRVYQTDNYIPANSEFEISSNDFLNAENNNIFGFIKASNANNDYFFHEDMDDYSSTETFTKSWDNIISCNRSSHENSTVKSYNNIVVSGSGNYLSQYSANATEMPIVIKRFAEIGEEFQLKYSMYIDNTDTNTTPSSSISDSDNSYLRTWLAKFSKDPSDGRSISTGSNDKVNVVGDLYNAAAKMQYTTAGSNSTSNISYTGKTANTWYDYVVYYNTITQIFNVYIYEGGTTNRICNAGNCNIINYAFANNNTIHTTNSVYFSGRGSSKSFSRISDVTVIPILSNIYTDLNIDGNSIGTGLYQDLTKAYLYKYDTSTTNALVATTSLGTTPTTSENITYSPSSGDKEYATISASSSNKTREYKVYFGADDEGKDLLLQQTINTALGYNKILYTNDTYNNLLTAINEGTNSFKSHNLTPVEIQVYIDNINTAINDLVNRVDFDLSYKAKITEGTDYNDFSNYPVNITNKSSLTVNFKLDTRASEEGYLYADKTHKRYLETNATFPVGTKITMIDRSEGDVEYYYYYVTTADYDSNKLEYLVTDFKLMGTTNKYFDRTYNYDSTTRKIYGNYSFVIDFVSVTDATKFGTQTNTLTFDLDIVENNVSTNVASSNLVSYNIYNLSNHIEVITNMNKKYYTKSSSYGTNILSIETNVDPIISSALVENGILVKDTRFSDYKSGIKFSLYNEAGTILYPFSKGTVIKNLTTNVVYPLTNDNAFRISNTSNISSFTNTYDFSSIFNVLNVGKYSLRTDYIAVIDGVSDSHILSTTYIDFEIKEDPYCAIYASVNDGNGIVNMSKSNHFNSTINVQCDGIESNVDIVAQLYKKNNNLFNSFGYTAVNLNNYFTTEDYLQYDDDVNERLLDTIVYVSRSDLSRTINVNTSLSNSVQSGTYKAVFSAIVDGVRVSDTYSFYIKND